MVDANAPGTRDKYLLNLWAMDEIYLLSTGLSLIFEKRQKYCQLFLVSADFEVHPTHKIKVRRGRYMSFMFIMVVDLLH
jgi:hypothetical protein